MTMTYRISCRLQREVCTLYNRKIIIATNSDRKLGGKHSFSDARELEKTSALLFRQPKPTVALSGEEGVSSSRLPIGRGPGTSLRPSHTCQLRADNILCNKRGHTCGRLADARPPRSVAIRRDVIRGVSYKGQCRPRLMTFPRGWLQRLTGEEKAPKTACCCGLSISFSAALMLVFGGAA